MSASGDSPARFSLFDRVRVSSTPETVERKLAGLVGQIYGETRPSSSGVEDIVGTLRKDYALNVHFKDLDADYWFAPELLEFVDHAAGTVLSAGAVAGESVRLPSGQWEVRLPGGPAPAELAAGIDFDKSFTDLVYGLRNIDQWDLAKRLKAAFGDGSFTLASVERLRLDWDSLRGELESIRGSLPAKNAQALTDVAAYLELWSGLPARFSQGDRVHVAAGESGWPETVSGKIDGLPVLGRGPNRLNDQWRVRFDRPHRTSDGKGPYEEAQVLGRYLSARRLK